MFVSERTADAAIAGSARKGVLEGKSLARVFAWVRPNDLVWNYWVNNYLMGESPPAFDVLAWNSDATNLPAALHSDIVQLFVDNSLMRPGPLKVLGTVVDLRDVTCDTYIVAAVNDHLVPWQAAYGATRALRRGHEIRALEQRTHPSTHQPTREPEGDVLHQRRLPSRASAVAERRRDAPRQLVDRLGRVDSRPLRAAEAPTKAARPREADRARARAGDICPQRLTMRRCRSRSSEPADTASVSRPKGRGRHCCC